MGGFSVDQASSISDGRERPTCRVRPLRPPCLVLHGNAVAVTPLVDAVEALSVLDGDVQLLSELLERLVRRQVQTVKAEAGTEEDNLF